MIFLFFIEKILKLKTYFHHFFEIHGPWIFENQCPWNFWNSWSMIFWKSMSQDFLKIMVHDFLKINVPRFFEIHGPWFFEIQCPKDFCDFGLLSRLAQAEGLIDYYMIFHYQKVTILNYWQSKNLPVFIFNRYRTVLK